MSDVLVILFTIVAVVAVGLVLLFAALVIAAVIYGWRDRHKVLSEEDAAENGRPWRPSVFPIDPAYIGLPPHNGRTTDSRQDAEETL